MDPLETGKFIATLAALAGFYLKIQSSLRTMAGKGDAREITNNPLNVQAIARVATMEDVNKVEMRVTTLEVRIEAHQAAAALWREGLSEDLTDLRDRMDDKLTVVSEELREIGRSVGRLEGS